MASVYQVEEVQIDPTVWDLEKIERLDSFVNVPSSDGQQEIRKTAPEAEPIVSLAESLFSTKDKCKSWVE